MSLLEDSDCLIRHLATEKSFSNVRSTANRIKTVCITNAAAAKERKRHDDDRDVSFGFHFCFSSASHKRQFELKEGILAISQLQSEIMDGRWIGYAPTVHAYTLRTRCLG